MYSGVTVAFVDDHPMLLEGVSALFARRGFDVVGKGVSADDVRSIYESSAPALMFVDLSMPGDPFESIADVSKSGSTKVVVYTAYTSIDMALKALDCGASAFVVKDSISNELFEAVDAVLRGEIFISRAHSGRVLAGLRNRTARLSAERAVKLSEREKQVVTLLLKAQSNKEIANTLKISEKTVKHHMTNLMSKLHARNRVEVALAAQHRIDSGG